MSNKSHRENILFSVYPHGNVWSKPGKSDNLFSLFTAESKFYSFSFPNSWPAVVFSICSVLCWHCKHCMCFRGEHQKMDCFFKNPHSAVVFPYVLYSVCLQHVQPFCMTDSRNAIKQSG